MLKVLVIKPSSLGDIIHSAGAIATLAQAGGGTRVTWLVNEEYADFVRELPGVSEVLPFPRRRFRRARFPWWVPQAVSWLRSLRQGFDIAVDLQGLQRSGMMARMSGARERFGMRGARELGWVHYNRRIEVPADLVHAIDRVNHVVREVITGSRLLTAEATPIPSPCDGFRIPVPAAARESLATLVETDARPWLAFCPGTRWASKLWPTAQWSDLLVRLRERLPDTRPVFLGAPGEKDLIDTIIAAAGIDADNLAGRVSLWQTAAALERAVAAITVDSGPLHLAAAVGTPTVSLFGPTDPDRVAPRGDAHRVLRRTDLDCLGCHSRTCARARRACLLDVEPAQVLEALEDVLPT